MRRHLVALFALASVAVIAAAAIANAASSNTNVASVKVKPSTLSKTKFKPVKKVTFEVSTVKNGDPGSPQHPTMFPSPATETDVAFDKDFQFNSKGLATCAANKLNGATLQQARAACGKAIVGTGSGTACALNPTNGSCALVVPAQVLAFNAKPKSGNPGIVFWTSNAVTGETTINGVIKKTSGKFSHRLNAKVPLLGGGAGSITDFKVNVTRKFIFKSEKVGFIEVKCSDRKLEIKGYWKFLDGTKNTDVGSTSCKN
jgi:hypothetical protein